MMEVAEENLQSGHEGPGSKKKLYKCTECNFENQMICNFNSHMACHTRNQKIKCPLCSFSAKAKFYVSRHLKLHHLNIPNIVPQHQLAYLEEMNYVIETLLDLNEKKSQSEQSTTHPGGNHESISISVHEQVEKEGTSHQSEESTDVLRSEKQLETNTKIGCKSPPPLLPINEEVENNNSKDTTKESSEFVFKCELCNYSTEHSPNARVHEKAHNNQGDDREFQCNLCNYSSNLEFVVIRHMNRDHQCPAPSIINGNLEHYENQHYLPAKEMDSTTASMKVESLDVDGHQENIHIKSNTGRYLESEEIGTNYTEKFEFVDLSDEDETNMAEGVDTYIGAKFDFLNVFHQDNSNIGSYPGSYLESEEIGNSFYTPKTEFVDLCDDDDDDDDNDEESKENLVTICPWANNPVEDDLQQQKSFQLIEDRKLEMEEAECRKQISQCREDIRKARISMTEMRNKIKSQKRILSSKVEQKGIKSRWLATIRTNNKKVTDLSLEYKKLEILRTHITEIGQRKLESVAQLRKVMMEQQFHLHYCADCCASNVNKRVVDLTKSDEMETRIGWLKRSIDGMQKELEFLEREERVLSKDVGLLYKSLNAIGVGHKVSEQRMQFLEMEIEEIEREIKTSLRDEAEDVFNQLVISTEEKIKNLFSLKNNLFNIMFLRKSAYSRKMNY